MINYNTFDLTCAGISSVIEKTHEVSYEIILVDNGSNEIPPDNFLERFPDIKLVKSPVNVGFAKGVNLGLKSAIADTCLLLNNDVIVDSKCISLCHSALQQGNGYGAITTKIVYPDGRVQHNCQRFPSIKHEFIFLLRLHKWLLKKRMGELLLGPFFLYNKNIDPDWIWGTFLMFPSSVVKEMPNQQWDDTYFLYGDDLLWCYQLRKRGHRIGFISGAEVIHYKGMSTPSDKARRLQLLHEMHFMKQNYSIPGVFMLIVLRLLNYLTLGMHSKIYLQLFRETLRLYLRPKEKLLSEKS